MDGIGMSIRLRCLELAVERANKENAIPFEDRVAELTSWFYNRIVDEPDVAAPEPEVLMQPGTVQSPQVRRKKDKSAPDIMD
jgi:hypothetical protein